MSAPKHKPVLINEVIHYLLPEDGQTILDCTFGAGGYSKELLKTAKCKVLAMDRDPSVIEFARPLIDKYEGRFKFFQGNFGDIKQVIPSSYHGKIDAIVLDIGVSSMQIDEAERGFSFQREGPLDMRMSKTGKSAYDLINAAPESELADIIYQYGEERNSRRIARAIVDARSLSPISTTLELRDIIHSVSQKGKKIDPATKTFQALRIWVNDELEELESALKDALDLLKPLGKLLVVTFHSLEDRIVKKFFEEKSGKTVNLSRYFPLINKPVTKKLDIITKHPVTATDGEITENPRSRSAKLRAAQKIGGNNG